MQKHKKMSARILSLALSVAMVTTMLPMTVFAAEGDAPLGASAVGTIQSFDKLGDRFIPAVGKDAPDHVYGLSVEPNTPAEDLNLPDELTATVARTTTVSVPAVDETIPDEDKVVGDDTATDETVSGNQPTTPSDAEEGTDETTEIKDGNTPLAPEPEQNEETLATTVEQETIPVTWQSDKEYQPGENGTFTYTAVLPEGYILADGVELPQIYVAVGKQARAASVSPPTVEIISDTNFIFANGNALVIEGTSNASTTVYIDTNRNGVKDIDEPSLASANISGAPTDDSDLSRWYICGGTNTDAFTGNTLITMNGGCVSTIVGGCYNAAMEGDTTVRVKGGTVKNSITSGNRSAGSVTGNTDITIENGVIDQVFLNIDNVTISGNVSVTISGGTIQGVKLKGTIGGGKELIIDGGSVKEVAPEIEVKNSSGTLLKQYIFPLNEISGITNINQISFSGNYSYGANGVTTDASGGLYLYCPATGNTVTSVAVTVGGQIYSSTISGAGTIIYLYPTTVTTVTVGPATPGVLKGGSKQFMAVVNGTAGRGGLSKPPQTVTWSLVGNTKLGTTLSTSGLLTVAADEPVGTELTITATSTVDTSKSDSIKTKVIDGPSVTMGAQTGALTYHGADAATFAVTASGFAAAPAASDYTLTWFSDAAGNTATSAPNLTVTKTSTTTLTIAPGTANAGTYYFKLTATKGSENATSSVVTATVGKATATTAMTKVTTSVSKDGATGATVTLPAKPAAATYGTITYGGTITCSNATVTGDTLTYTAPTSTVGDTGTITIPVTTATNYNDYSIVVTITSTDKKAATITAAVADKTYNGVAVTQPTPTAVEKDTATPVTLTYTYKWQKSNGSGGYTDISGNTAPKDAGSYKLVIDGSNDTHAGTKEIAFTISKATVTITADNKSAYVGDAKPTLTYTAAGLASGDTLVTVPTLTYESEPDMSKAGSVKIKANGAVVPNTDNYGSAITYVDGTLTISNKSSGGGGGGGGSSSGGSNVTVDGKPENIGKVESTTSTTTVVVDSAKLDSKVSDAKDGSSVVIPVTTSKDSAAAQLVMESVEKMAAKDMTLEVKSGKTTYALPAAAIDTAGIVAKLGATDASKVPFTVTITNEKNVKVEGATVVGTPTSFTVTATYGGKSVTVDRFDTMVARTMEVTAAQAKQVTTAVVVDDSGVTRHVPTNVYQSDGKWYAKVNSMTNSTYALIENKSALTDLDSHWYADAANELSARKVTDGVFPAAFDGGKDITRAEFAALLVNGLGLPKTANADFSDVSADAWYSKHVATAAEYGIVNGIGGGKFAPDATITRQEAMVMMARAAQVMGYAGKSGELTGFSDMADVGAWAVDGAKFSVGSGLIVGNDGKLMPRDNITRGETATVVLRLLQQAGLVDVRAKA